MEYGDRGGSWGKEHKVQKLGPPRSGRLEKAVHRFRFLYFYLKKFDVSLNASVVQTFVSHGAFCRVDMARRLAWHCQSERPLRILPLRHVCPNWRSTSVALAQRLVCLVMMSFILGKACLLHMNDLGVSLRHWMITRVSIMFPTRRNVTSDRQLYETPSRQYMYDRHGIRCNTNETRRED